MNITNFKEVLVLAPHTDDGELGCGGTISKLVNSGSQVTYVAFSIAEESVPSGLPKDVLATEVANATAVLGIKKSNLIILKYKVRKLNYFRQEILEELIRIRKLKKFDLVIMPSLNDVHQDHATIAQEGLRAFKNTTILSYELIWNNVEFSSKCFVELDEIHIQNKIKALNEYKSQGFRNYLSSEFIFSLAKVRGTQVSVNLAESFEIIRLFL